MKKIIFTFLWLFLILTFTSCGNGDTCKESTLSSTQLNNLSTNSTDEDRFSFVDTSKSYSKQLQEIFSGLEPHSQFFDVKIKEVSHPKKFVGTWTMWEGFRGGRTTFNADGSCRDTFYFYKTGENQERHCEQWYHITLEDKKGSFLLFLYKDYVSLVNYEWSDENNIYFHYFRGGGHLATRANSSPLAKNIEERFILGTWAESTSDIKTFWIFDENHKFRVKIYAKESNKLLGDRKGTWSIDKRIVKISVPRSKLKENKYLAQSIPPSNIQLDFLGKKNQLSFKYFNGEHYLFTFREFFRDSEPIMISKDPFLGKFQAYATSRTFNAISLSIRKEFDSDYSVDIFWNNKLYLNNNAIKVNGLLNVETEFGKIIFKPVINGIQKINVLENNFFNFPERILRTSQKPVAIEKTVVGRWIQSVQYLEQVRYFTFLDNGKFFNYNGEHDVKIGREGRYKKEGNKIYFKARCGKKELLDTVELNQEHYTPQSYQTPFVKIANSQMLSSMWYALHQYDLVDKKRAIPLILDPKHSDRFLFKKEQKFSNIGSMTLTFKPNGEVLAYNYAFFSHYDYYIEKSEKGEQIVMFQNLNKATQIATDAILSLYDGRETVCYNDSIELGLE